jgi:phosphate transport system substrate-binding protein
MSARVLTSIAVLTGLAVIPACGSAPAETTNTVKLQGAGASFPAPLYTKWFKSYSTSHQNVLVDYQSVGSGSGVKSVIDHTVDFGASDAAMKPEDMAKVPEGVQLFPMTAGSIVLAYHLEGVSDLKLSRKAYSGIFLGTIKRWNDQTIAEANPGAKLPDLPINVVVRADSSGTSFVFSQHLSAVSDDFGKTVGANTMPNWPTGTKSKGNEGVTAAILSTPGSIGYIEYGYAKSQKMPMATLENKSGKFVQASTASGQAALASAALPEDMIVWAKDPEVPEAYPIVTYTWLICYKKYPSKDKVQAVQDLVKYGLTEGQKDAETLGYIPLPDAVVAKATTALQSLGAQ